MNKLLNAIEKEFNELPKDEQIKILWKYVWYVEDYPETHDIDCYPACFLEWYTNDYEESK